MASRRRLKKEINNICYDLISECLTFQHFHPTVHDEEIAGIIEDILKQREDYLSRINKPDGKDNPVLVKKHFRAITDDMLNKTIPLLDKLKEPSSK